MNITEFIKTEAVKNIENNYPKLYKYLENKLSHREITSCPSSWKPTYNVFGVFKFGRSVPASYHTSILVGETAPIRSTLRFNEVELDEVTSPILEVLESLLNREWEFLPRSEPDTLFKYESLRILTRPYGYPDRLCKTLQSACNDYEKLLVADVSEHMWNVMKGVHKRSLRADSKEIISKIFTK